MTHLGIVVPLPHIPCGAAESMATSLPFLEQLADVTCFVEDVDEINPELRAKHDIRNVNERNDKSIDALIYHIGNNPHHKFVLDAIMEGPAGLVEVHDGSLHHFVQDQYLGRSLQPFRYAAFGEAAHGYAGRRLAEMRFHAYRGVSELFLYDYLQIALDRSFGVITHSEYARSLVEMRCPNVPTWKVPLHSPPVDPTPIDRSFTNIPEGRLILAHCGFVTLPKRPLLYLEALRDAIDRGLDAHFVFVGADATQGLIDSAITRLDLQGRVTVTGYLSTQELDDWVRAVDVIVNLRAPHVGESSGSLSHGLSAGKPVIVQPIGSWAEFPDDVVVRLPVTDDDTKPLARTFFALGQDARLRARFGKAARMYAKNFLSADRCAQGIVQAAEEARRHNATPPAWEWPTRIAAVRMFHESGAARICNFFDDNDACNAEKLYEAARRITPARPGARLLAIDAPDAFLQLMGSVYGYCVDARVTHGDNSDVICEQQPGIGPFRTTRTAFDIHERVLGYFDVIFATRPLANCDFKTFLNWCNLALKPQGLLVFSNSAIDNDTLEHAGFSAHIHNDTPDVMLQPAHCVADITAATKATLPG